MTWGTADLVPAVSPRARWAVSTLASAGAGVFATGLGVQLACRLGHCPPGAVRRLFDLEAVGALPRLFTTVVFGCVALIVGLGCRRVTGAARAWWALVALGGTVLAVAKWVSAHSAVEQRDGWLATLAVGVSAAVVGLSVLWWTGRRWAVPGAAPVVLALAAYAAAALGLDEVTAVVTALWHRGSVRAVAVFAEEAGEAATAVMVLATVVRAAPHRPAVSRRDR